MKNSRSRDWSADWSLRNCERSPFSFRISLGKRERDVLLDRICPRPDWRSMRDRTLNRGEYLFMTAACVCVCVLTKWSDVVSSCKRLVDCAV